MRCGKAQKLVSVSLDRELDQPRVGALRAHVANCRACRRFADRLAGCAGALDSLAVPEPRPGFTERVLARLAETRGGPARLREWALALRPVPVAAAILAAACGVGLALSMDLNRASPAPDRRQASAAELCADTFEALPGESVAATYLALLRDVERRP